MLGTTISHYLVIEKLGEGGMGVVYRARDTRLDRDVALKVLTGESMTGDVRSRLIREAKAAAALNHPNIAHIYEVGDVGGTSYIAMEYVDGETLRVKMRSPQSSLFELLEYLRQTAAVLSKAHAKGLVHCDLKPENIMVTSEGLVKLLDFGLAKLVQDYGRELAVLDPRTLTQTSLPSAMGSDTGGTLGYMSPEQAEGKRLNGGRSDVFSFGCILFETIAHRVPFSGKSAVHALHSLIYDPAPPIHDFAPGAPPALQGILDVCLKKDPEQRAAMEDVDRRLENVLHGHAVSPNLLARRRPLRRPSGRIRIPLRTAIYGLGVVLLLVVVALSLRRTAATAIDSIAVIPFVNSGDTPGTDFLSDGISEGLINNLAQLPNLKVIARSSSFKFKGAGIDVRTVARTLGVGVLVTGRLAQMNGQLRMTVELVKGSDGTQLWGAQYRGAVSDVADVQSRMVREIAQQVRSQLTASDQKKLAKAGAANSEAYELLLRGRYEMRLYNPKSTQKAVDYYREALALDPGYAMAHAELAYSYRLLSGAGILKPEETLPLAEAAARRALSADDGLAQAHAALGDILKDKWDWAGAEREYRQALALNPNLVAAHSGLANYLSLHGRFASAIEEILLARELDPVGVPTAINAAAVYYNARQYDNAIRTLEHAAQLDSSAPALLTWKGIVYGGSGRFAQAIDSFESAFRLGDRTAATRCNYAYSLARAGKRDRAMQVLRDIARSGDFIPPVALAVAYAGLDDKERAIHLLLTAYAARDPLLQYINVESQLDALHHDRRYQDLVAKIGLPR